MDNKDNKTTLPDTEAEAAMMYYDDPDADLYEIEPAAQGPQAQQPGGKQTDDDIDLDDFKIAIDLDIAMGVSRSKAHKIVEYTEQYLKKFPVRLTDLMTPEGAKQAVSKILTEINCELWREYNTEAEIATQSGVEFKKKPPAMLEELPAYVAAAMLIGSGDVKVLRTGTNSHVIVSRHYYRNSATANEWKMAGAWNISHKDDPVSPVMRIYTMMCPSAKHNDVTVFWRNLMRGPVVASAMLDKKLVFFLNGVWDYGSRSFTPYDSPQYLEKYGSKVILAVVPVYHPFGPGAILKPEQGAELPQVVKDTIGAYPAGCRVLEEQNQFWHLPDLVLHNDTDGMDWRPFDLITASFDMTSEMGMASSIIIQQSMQCMLRNINPFPHLYHIWINRGGEGGNGKSTLFAAYRRLVELPAGVTDASGEDADITGTALPNNRGAVISARIDELGNNYVLGENMLTAKIIVGEEMDYQNTYIEKCAIVKDLSRVQEVTVREIYGAPLRVTYTGFLLQESNDFPRFADKTDSMVSHLVGVPFDKPFGVKRPYIKSDYVMREEVAEWLAYYLTVEMAAVDRYDDWSIATLKPISREMLVESSTALRFLDEAVKGLRMEFMPTELLFDLFLRWAAKNNISARSTVDKGTFLKAMEQFAVNNEYGIEVLKPYGKRNSDPQAAKRKRTVMSDLNQDHPFLMEYGNVVINGELSPYQDHNISRKFGGRLAEPVFKDLNGKRGRVWSSGGLLRVAKPWSAVVVDDDTDVEDD